MNETGNIVALRQLDDIDDPLTNILRAGAGQLLVQAVEIEVETFLATVKDLKLAPRNVDRRLRREIPRQVQPGGRMPRQGLRRAAGLP